MGLVIEFIEYADLIINFYDVKREALTMTVTCVKRIKATSNITITKSVSTIQQSVKLNFFSLLLAFPGILLEKQEKKKKNSPSGQDFYTFSTSR